MPSNEDIEAFSHSDRLVLVGPGNVLLGAYTSTDATAVDRLRKRVQLLAKMAEAAETPWVLRLPGINAGLNSTCALLLVVGWLLIRSGRVKAHAACMVAAITVSGLFLGCYLLYHYHVGSVPFRGVGPVRVVYLSILLSHTVLAIVVVPMIAWTVAQAVRGRFAAHARIARATFPIWLYVSITGVVVYWMLYRMAAGGQILA